MQNLLKIHIQTQETALDHAILGIIGSFLFATIVGVYTYALIPTIIAFILGGFIAGILIEVTQIVQRLGKKQNTKQEMILDALMTGCWAYVFYLKRRR